MARSRVESGVEPIGFRDALGRRLAGELPVICRSSSSKTEVAASGSSLYGNARYPCLYIFVSPAGTDPPKRRQHNACCIPSTSLQDTPDMIWVNHLGSLLPQPGLGCVRQLHITLDLPETSSVISNPMKWEPLRLMRRRQCQRS